MSQLSLELLYRAVFRREMNHFSDLPKNELQLLSFLESSRKLEVVVKAL